MKILINVFKVVFSLVILSVIYLGYNIIICQNNYIKSLNSEWKEYYNEWAKKDSIIKAYKKDNDFLKYQKKHNERTEKSY